MKDLLQDLRYGLRMLRKNPGFAAVATARRAVKVDPMIALRTE